ncbi:hypothetical protein LSH36_222g03052 [Paralvinella palmiformis]|uniref:LanC-like protein 2 n=1 Tax=Paralvinella palmiformis TaxID=53620 RepID=A0AAD9N6L8_9ANNE|nr:hypothetical protein LSH36_222g03052 [Paralvinella palmiformis]
MGPAPSKRKQANTSITSSTSSNMSHGGSHQREFPNEFPDYDGSKVLDDDGKMPREFTEKLKSTIEVMLQKLDSGLETHTDWSDYSVYTGTTGIALLYFHLHDKFGEGDRYLEKALHYIDEPLNHLKRRKHTFLCGDAGPLALGAVIYHKLGKENDKQECLKRLFSRGQDVVEDRSLPDELLFGRVGYLFALNFVQHHLGSDCVDQDLLAKVFRKVLQSGEALVRQEGHCPCPLMYEWHDKKYLGAAHGLSGIMYILMQPTVDYLQELRFPSGNFPSSIGSPSGDKLIHWCHGAPGWIHMFILSYKVFSSEKYLKDARSCAEVIWKRGLLRKGYGICHGVAGNAYGFVALYNLTGEEKYLYRAVKFAEWCFDYGHHGCRIPDRPYSLFEGLAGTIYFLVDLLDPAKARFPAFDLST